MRIADLILPVFAVILTGWIVGYTGYLSRALSDALIHFAYNIAMPALLIVTIAQEPSSFADQLALSCCLWWWLPPLLHPRVRHHEHSCFPKSRKPNDAWHGGIDDQYRLRRLTRPAGDLWSARRVAGGDRHGIRGRCDVSSSRDLARTWSAGCAWLTHGPNGHS